MSRAKQAEIVVGALGRRAGKHGPQFGILGQVLIKHLIDAQPDKEPVKVLQELHQKLVAAQRGPLERSKGKSK